MPLGLGNDSEAPEQKLVDGGNCSPPPLLGDQEGEGDQLLGDGDQLLGDQLLE